MQPADYRYLKYPLLNQGGYFFVFSCAWYLICYAWNGDLHSRKIDNNASQNAGRKYDIHVKN